MSDTHKHEPLDRLVHGYEQMLERTREHLDNAEESVPKFRQWLESARDHMVELGELTREEANRIADYIERDIEDAAHFIVENGEDLKAWWRFDLELIEDRLLDLFTSVADQTSVELSQWAERARKDRLYRAGEITGPGTLVCDRCGARVQFPRPGTIPECPECAATEFRRGRTDDNA